MSALSAAFATIVAPDLLTVRGRIGTTLEDLIGIKGAFYSSYREADGSWEFDFAEPFLLNEFLATESSRFACASFQSFFQLREEIEDSDKIPWALIKCYYSAFYAAHCILRLRGSTCTYVDGNQAATTKKVLALQGTHSDFAGGVYRTATMPSGSGLSFYPCNARGGGTHEILWRIFAQHLDDLGSAALSSDQLNQMEAQEVFVAFSDLKGALSRGNSGGTWLSIIRNNVQYRHQLKSWFPNRPSERDRKALRKVCLGWRQDPCSVDINNEDDLVEFFSICTYLVSLCRLLIVEIAERSQLRDKSFVHYGPMRFLKSRNCH